MIPSAPIVACNGGAAASGLGGGEGGGDAPGGGGGEGGGDAPGGGGAEKESFKPGCPACDDGKEEMELELQKEDKEKQRDEKEQKQKDGTWTKEDVRLPSRICLCHANVFSIITA